MEMATISVRPDFAHKVKPDNVLITDVSDIDEKKNMYKTNLIINTEHYFFYDYPFEVDHIPGIVLIEATKQMGCVIAHEYWDIPMNYAFAPIKASSKFIRFVEIDLETTIQAEATYKSVFGGISLAKMTAEVFQKGVKLGVMKTDFVFIKPEIYKKLRKNMESKVFSKMMDLVRKL